MPVYVYRRSDGSTFEFEQRITAEPLTNCPISAQRVERVLQPFSARYKCTGFYLTDYPKGSLPREPAPATEKKR
jgi:predicted nucleic acid-binding Zn ribbon protein